MAVSPLAGKPAEPGTLVDVPRLVAAYYTEPPDPGVPEQPGQLFGAAQLAGLRVGDLVVGKIAAARNMAAAQPGPGLFGSSFEPLTQTCDRRGRTGVQVQDRREEAGV